VQGLLERVDTVIRSIRELVSQLRPPALDGGLAAAIEWLAAGFEKQTGIACELELADCPAFSQQDAATMAFRVVQESLTNVRRHAGATVVRIRLTSNGPTSSLEIVDNGRGFDPAEVQGRFGLLGMEERVSALGGKLAIVSSPGRGTAVTVTLEGHVRAAAAHQAAEARSPG
jgi:signal transduction histidine kinase